MKDKGLIQLLESTTFDAKQNYVGNQISYPLIKIFFLNQLG